MTSPPGPAVRRGPRPAWLVVGLAIGLLGGWLVAGRSAPALDAARLGEARERWQRVAPASYRLEVETRGPMGRRHEIEVRAGEVVRMATGGVEATRSAWRYWSVDGLFDFLDAELANAADPQRAYGAPPGSVVLKARFDERWGYPSYFLRHVLGQRASVEWRVLRFEPLAAAG